MLEYATIPNMENMEKNAINVGTMSKHGPVHMVYGKWTRFKITHIVRMGDKLKET